MSLRMTFIEKRVIIMVKRVVLVSKKGFTNNENDDAVPSHWPKNSSRRQRKN
jgi:hypothetical protein